MTFPTPALLATALALALAAPASDAATAGGMRDARLLPEAQARGDRPPPPGRAEPRPGRDVPPRPPGLGGELPPGHGGARPERSLRPDPEPAAGSGRPGSAQACGAGVEQPAGPVGQSGRSHMAHVALGADPGDGDLPRARMSYRWIGPTLVANLQGKRLGAGTDWSLVVLDEDGTALCLGEGTSNPGGNLQLAIAVDPEGHLPFDLDPFAAPDPDAADADATLVLLPSADVDCESGAFAPGEDALVGRAGLRFVDTDVLVCE
jgi:hypothetical protein